MHEIKCEMILKRGDKFILYREVKMMKKKYGSEAIDITIETKMKQLNKRKEISHIYILCHYAYLTIRGVRI